MLSPSKHESDFFSSLLEYRVADKVAPASCRLEAGATYQFTNSLIYRPAMLGYSPSRSCIRPHQARNAGAESKRGSLLTTVTHFNEPNRQRSA